MNQREKYLFSDHFKLAKSQALLDFVDVPLSQGDIPLFIDPYVISLRSDNWSIDCHNMIFNFFQEVVTRIKNDKLQGAKELLAGLSEPNETKLGLSKGKTSRGRGIGPEQADHLFVALKESTAVKTGFVENLEDCELLIDGISKDKISDITTNIIKSKLIEYTAIQCKLYDIPTQTQSIKNVWSPTQNCWTSVYADLPTYDYLPIILIPKAITRRSLIFNHQNFYNHEILGYLQEEHYNSDSSLNRTLKSGAKRPPTKKDLKEKHPISKQFIFETTKEKPILLENYKNRVTRTFDDISNGDILRILNLPFEDQNEQLIKTLKSIPVGAKDASAYHDFITGILSFVFYPMLISPQKEKEIHDGRKRIDIVFTNSARDQFFWNIHAKRNIPCPYIMFECKNYSTDVKNPELDQLAGRFSPNRGRLGFLVCRKFENKELFIQRCKDTVNDDRGWIIPLDDQDVERLMKFSSSNQRNHINNYLEEAYKKLVF